MKKLLHALAGCAFAAKRKQPHARAATSRSLAVLRRGCSGAAAGAFAAAATLSPAGAAVGPPEPMPEIPQVDANGVDLHTGYLTLSTTDIAIGPAGQGLSYGRAFVRDAWRGAALGSISEIPSDDPFFRRFAVSVGGSAEIFELDDGDYTPKYASGSWLRRGLDSNILDYGLADGTIITFDRRLAGKVDDAITTAVMTKVTAPNGAETVYHYDEETVSKLGKTDTRARLESITNSYGYQLHFEYKFRQNPEDFNELNNEWRELRKVTALNNKVAYCAPTANSCSPAGDWPTVQYSGATFFPFYFKDVAGRETFYTYDLSCPPDVLSDGGCISKIETEGNAPGSPRRTAVEYSYDNTGRVIKVDRGYAAWRYRYTDLPGQNIRVVEVIKIIGVEPDGEEVHADERSYQSVLSGSGEGMIIASFDAARQQTQYEYSGKRVSKITYPEGNRVEYTYDSRGNLTRTAAFPKSGGGSIVSDAGYILSCNARRDKNCNKPLWTRDAEQVKAGGADNRTDYTYSSTHGGVLTITGARPAPGVDRPRVYYDYQQMSAYYRQSASGAQAGPAMWTMTAERGCATAQACAGGANETRTAYAYLSGTTLRNLQPASITVSAGDGSDASTVSYAYDDYGMLIRTDGALTTADGLAANDEDAVYYHYDDAWRLVRTVAPNPSGSGFSAQVTEYDDRGRPFAVRIGTTTSRTNGAAAFTTLQRTETFFDVHDRPIRAVVYDGASSTIVSMTQTQYDNRGRVACTALRMQPDGNFASAPANACTLTTPAGVYGQDRVSRNVYDKDRLQKVVSAFGTGLAQDTITYTYTNNGLVSTLRDARGAVTQYVYDGYDRLSEVRYPNPTTAGAANPNDREIFTYNDNGLVLRYTPRGGGTNYFEHEYDNLSRLVRRNAPGSQPDITYAYDLLGRMTSASQPGHAIAMAYDGQGRLESETGPLGTVAYRYDRGGRRTRTTWPGTFHTTYDYNAASALTDIRENGAASLTAYGYDTLGRRTSITRGNNTTTRYAYDGVSRLSCLRQDFINGNAPSECGETPASATGPDDVYRFAYSPASQITERAGANPDRPYDFRPQEEVAETYTANLLSQVLATAGAPAIQYDARGNMTTDGANAYGYDFDNRLTSADLGAGAVSLAYDPLGRLYEIAVAGGATTRFLYDGADIIGEYEPGSGSGSGGANSLLRRYVHGPGIDEPAVWYEGAGTNDKRWLHADERGSVIALSNGSGAQTDANAYAPYGAPGANNKGRFQYTGQIWIEEIALYHYKARSYNPILGRFMQTDPIGYADGMNLYAYAGNDPVNATDPTGLCDSKENCTPNDFIDHIIVPGVRPPAPVIPITPPFFVPDFDFDFGNPGPGFTPPPPPQDQQEEQEQQDEEKKKKKKKCLVGEVDLSIGLQGGFVVNISDVLKGGIILDLGSARATGNSRTGFSRTVTQGGLVSLGASIPGTGLGVGRTLQAGYAVPYGGTSGEGLIDAFRTLDYVSRTQQINGEFAIPTTPVDFAGFELGIARIVGGRVKVGFETLPAGEDC